MTRRTSIVIVLAMTSVLSLSLLGCSDDSEEPVVVSPSIETDMTTISPAAPDTDVAPPAPLGDVSLRLETLAEGLSHPVQVLTAAGDDRLFVVEKTGRVKILDGAGISETPFLDISSTVSDGGEQGLLGLAFSPRIGTKGFVYANYTNTDGDTVIARYRVSPHDSSIVSVSTREELLVIEQPFSNHNGGFLLFGPDDMLWIGTGDGGSAGDPFNNARNPGSLLGKMLRIDVGESGRRTEGAPYGIPGDNPFLGMPGYREEIWGIGLRNPWRYSFDRETGDLWIGDVGQNEWEEVDLVLAEDLSAGANFGWDLMEGTHPYPDGADPGDISAFTPPVVEYSHSAGQSITGGYVYRGARYPELRGVYVYADFYGSVWGLRLNAVEPENVLLWEGDVHISSFGEDNTGELLACDLDGAVYRVEFDIE